MAGRIISHFEILEPIGQGGMGEVFKARDLDLGRIVAIKLLRKERFSEEESKTRFIQEAQAASALDHPNICTIYEIARSEDDELYIAMAYYPGETLRERFQKQPLSEEAAVNTGIQVATGLEKAHAAGIVHRDIKPANIIFTEDNLVKILDFGVAKLSGQSELTQTGALLGSFAYMSPEQFTGEESGIAVDIWALGVTLYESLAGVLPFKPDRFQNLLFKILNEPPRPLNELRPDVSPDLVQFLEKAMAKKTEDRFEDMSSFLKALLKAHLHQHLPLSTVTKFDPEELKSALKTPATTDDSPSGRIRLRQGERRFVTVLCIEVRGFDPVTHSIDDERTLDLLEEMISHTQKTLEGHSGVVGECESNTIPAVFGVQTAGEDDPVRAINSGLAILSSLSKGQAEKSVNIENIRIGVHTGAVTIGRIGSQEKIIGPARDTAKHLQEQAEPGTMLVSETTRDLARHAFRFEEHGQIMEAGNRLKSFLVKGQVNRIDRWTRPDEQLTPFVGRKAELQVLNEMYARCCRKPEEQTILHLGPAAPHMLIGVQGDAGFGKSRLIRQFLTRMASPDQIVSGFCGSSYSRSHELLTSMVLSCLGASELGPGIPADLEDLFQSLEPYSDSSEELRKSRAMIENLLGFTNDDPRFTHLKPGALQTEMFIAFRVFIQAMAHSIFNRLKQPLMIAIDDFQWVDNPSRDALQFLISTAQTPLPLMILISYRPGARMPSVSEKKAQTREIHLDPLPAEDADTLLQKILEIDEIPEQIRRHIQIHSLGNPLYIEELIHHIMKIGCVSMDDTGWTITGSLDTADMPGSLRSLLLARIDSLDLSLKRTLQHASVLGPEFSHRSLKWIEDQLEEGADPQPHLDQLVERAFLTMDYSAPDSGVIEPIYAFRHILMCDATYDTLLLKNRRVLHKLCAESLEDLYSEHLEDYSFTLGKHWDYAGIPEKAVEYYFRAGERAKNLFANQEAIEAFTKVMDLVPGGDSITSSAREFRGEVYRLIGELDLALSDFEVCLAKYREGGDQILIADFLRKLADIQTIRGKTDEALPLLNEALEMDNRSGNEQGKAQNLYLIGSIHFTRHEYREAKRLYEEALAIHRKTGPKLMEANNLVNLGNIPFRQGRWNHARELYESALTIFQSIDSPKGEAMVQNNLGNVCNRTNKYKDALVHYQNSLSIHRKIGDRFEEASALNNIGTVYLDLTDYDKGHHWLNQSLELKQKLNDRHGQALTLYNIGQAYRDRHQSEEALKMFSSAQQIFIELGNIRLEAYSLLSTAQIIKNLENYDEAEALLKRALKLTRKTQDQTAEAYVLNNLGSVCADLQRYSDADKRCSEALSICVDLNDIHGKAMILGTKGSIKLVQGKLDSAQNYFMQALELSKESDYPGKEADMLKEVGRVFLAKDKVEDAVGYFQKSLKILRNISSIRLKSEVLNLFGICHSRQGQFEKAVELHQEAAVIEETLQKGLMAAYSRSMEAGAWIGLGERETAEKISLKSVEYLEKTLSEQTIDTQRHEQILFTHHLILTGANPVKAKVYLERAVELLNHRLSRLLDPAVKSFAENQFNNKQINSAWTDYLCKPGE